jgi:pilus assembly protein CpaE
VYPLSAGVIVETKELWEEISGCLDAAHVRTVFELPGLPDDRTALMDRIERLAPDVIILEVGTLRDPLENVVRQLRSVTSQPAVFAVRTEANPESILEALRAGASEYLYPPLEEPFHAALERLARSRESQHLRFQASGKLIAFISAKGGCGATTLACHVARELPQQVNGTVLLADLDLQVGQVGFLMKANSTYSLADAAANLQRLDRSYWKALVSNGLPGLEVITAPQAPAAKNLSATQLRQVLSFARTQYDWVILDLGRNLTTNTLSMLEMVDETYLVAVPELPALHEAKRMIQNLRDAGYPHALRLIVNRMTKGGEIRADEIGDMLGLPVFASVPSDYGALQDAYTERQLVNPSSKLGATFAQISAKIAGLPPKQKKFSLFG